MGLETEMEEGGAKIDWSGWEMMTMAVDWRWRQWRSGRDSEMRTTTMNWCEGNEMEQAETATQH